jgi:hypothetical protein
MEVQFPKYSVLDCGESYKASSVYQRLWRYHNTLVRRWKITSNEKFKKSQNGSNSKSTADSSRKSPKIKSVKKQKISAKCNNL